MHRTDKKCNLELPEFNYSYVFLYNAYMCEAMCIVLARNLGSLAEIGLHHWSKCLSNYLGTWNPYHNQNILLKSGCNGRYHYCAMQKEIFKTFFHSVWCWPWIDFSGSFSVRRSWSRLKEQNILLTDIPARNAVRASHSKIGWSTLLPV